MRTPDNYPDPLGVQPTVEREVIVIRALAIVVAGAAVAAVATATPALASTAVPHGAARASCGSWRWPVKTGADATRHQVERTAWNTSVRYLRSLHPPSHFGSYAHSHRIKWPEFHTWRLRHAFLVKAIREDDRDLHLVLRNHAGKTMIAEIPSPSCVSGRSLWKTQIRRARRSVTRRYMITSYYWTHIRRYVSIKGLGFFDEVHGQTGVAPNGIELHPVTRIRWR
jgi:hypothetical protein